MDKKTLDEQAKRIQEAIEAAEREARERERNSPEVQAEAAKFSAEMQKWEQGLDNPSVTVREFIGSPRILPPSEIPDEQLGAELERVLEILDSHNVLVGFLGDFTEREVYETIWFKALRETMADNYHPEWRIHFDYASPSYNVQQAIDFVLSDLAMEREYAPTFFAEEAFGADNQPLTQAKLRQLHEQIWRLSPLKYPFSLEMLAHEINKDKATATARVVWKRPNQIITIDASFKLQHSVYSEDGEGFEVVQTDLFYLLLNAVE